MFIFSLFPLSAAKIFIAFWYLQLYIYCTNFWNGTHLNIGFEWTWSKIQYWLSPRITIENVDKIKKDDMIKFMLSNDSRSSTFFQSKIESSTQASQ